MPARVTITFRCADGEVKQFTTTIGEAVALMNGHRPGIAGIATTPIVTEDGLLGEAATTPAATGEEV